MSSIIELLVNPRIVVCSSRGEFNKPELTHEFLLPHARSTREAETIARSTFSRETRIPLEQVSFVFEKDLGPMTPQTYRCWQGQFTETDPELADTLMDPGGWSNHLLLHTWYVGATYVHPLSHEHREEHYFGSSMLERAEDVHELFRSLLASRYWHILGFQPRVVEATYRGFKRLRAINLERHATLAQLRLMPTEHFGPTTN